MTITYSASSSVATQSDNVTTWPDRGITIGPYRESNITISAKSAYTTTAVTGVVTTGQNLNTINDIRITSGSGSTPVTSVTAAGATVEVFPRLSFASGAYQFVLNYSKLGSWSGTGTGFTVSDITASQSTGRRIVAASRGTTIGAARSITSTFTINTTINGIAINKSATHTLTQSLNTITSFTFVNSTAGDPTTSFTAAGGHGPYYPYFTWSSGSVGYSKTALSADMVYTISGSGFRLGNEIDAQSSYGIAVVADSRGTTIGPARSGVVTGTLDTTINGVTINKSFSQNLTQALNKVVSCTVLKNDFSYPAIAAAGGTSNPAGAATATYNFSSGSNGSPQGSTTTISYSMPSTSGFSINTSSGVVTATNNTSTSSRTSGTITRTVKYSYTNPSTVGGGTVGATSTKTATCTQSAGAKTYANPVVSLSYATIPAKGGTVTPTMSYSQTWGWNGATSGGGTITSGATVRYRGTSVNATSGAVSASSKGTNISNITTVTTATATVTLNDKSGSKSVAVKQAGNYVTTINVVGSSFQYADIGAGDTSAYPKSFSGGSVTYTFSSGSTSTTTPAATYGSYSVVTTYSLGSVVNGFTTVNSETGALTATNRGTTIGPARTSGVVTKTTKGTWTPTSGYNAAGVKTDTDNKTATCTQALNTITSIALYMSGPTPSAPKTDYPASGSSSGYVGIPTYSSGASGRTQNFVDYVNYSFSESWGRWEMHQDGYWGTLFVSTRGTVAGEARSGKLTCTIAGTINGVSVNVSGNLTITQEANDATTISYGSWVVSVSSNKYASSSAACPASGGSATITRSASRTRTQNYTSGDTSPLSAETATPTLSISGTGFTLSGTTATVANRTNVIGKARTATVTATHSGVSKSITLYQAENTVTSIEIRSCGGATEQPTVSYPASGAGYCFSFSCRFSSGLDHEDSVVDGLETWSFNQSWGSWAATSDNRWWGILTIPSRGTTIGAARSGTLTCTLKGTINGVSINTSDSVTITQAENTVTSSKIVPMSGSASDVNFPASGVSRGFIGELTLSSGSKIQGADYKNYITYSLTSSFGTFTPNAEKYYGIVTVASRGSTIGTQKSGTLTHKISGTINGVSINKTATLGLTQALNTITALTMMSGINTPVTTSYTAAGGKNTYTMDAT